MRMRIIKSTMYNSLLVSLMFAIIGNPLFADQVAVDVSMAQPFMNANKKQVTHVKVGLTGFTLKSSHDRPPVNVAIVLDKSGSMNGDKIRKAKEAAIMAVNRLSPNDIVSIITYDSTVNVLVPATKVSDKSSICRMINRINSGGSTALFAGVSKGAFEIRKFYDHNRVNRIILLSDGLANVGPSSPGELGSLGMSLGRERIAVSTIGLGLQYNEDLMTQLASNSDGNHAFAENASDLARIFDHEFGDVLSVVAQKVIVKINCAHGIRPIRVLGRDAQIYGNSVTTTLNQLYSDQQKYVLLEVEVPASAANISKKIADVNVSYENMVNKTTEKLSSLVSVRFTESQQIVEEKTDAKVMVDVVSQEANETGKKIVQLRDEGRKDEAAVLLQENTQYLRENEGRYKSSFLGKLRTMSEGFLSEFDDSSSWNRQRKKMKESQHSVEKQQSYSSSSK